AAAPLAPAVPAAPASVRVGGRSPWSSGATGAARDAGFEEPVPEGGEPQVGRAGRAPRSDEVVELLWFDPDTTARLRLRWPALCDALEFAPLDPRHDMPNPDPDAARARHLHFGVLTEAEQTDPRGLTAALREAVSDTGRFTAPLIALGGELELPFDELETLRATAAALGPLASEDKKLKDAIASANEIADSPVLKGSPEVVRNFIGHLRKLYREAKRSFPQDYLDECVDRMLLSERRYQKKTVFGGECIRALLTPGAATSATLGTREPVPTYLPVALEKQLPLMKSFRARLVVEGHFKQDQYEAHACALRAISLGRVLAFA
ncbi:MAG: hypothetical protein HY908_31490, partial [Myxococcales bacterium]|nr:hypothetical protein [Myxococcales bacterium]